MFYRVSCLRIVIVAKFSFVMFLPAQLLGHEHTRHQAVTRHFATRSVAESLQRDPAESCKLLLKLIHPSSGKTTTGLIRITNQATGDSVEIADQIRRDQGWYVLPPNATVDVPKAKLKIEGAFGLETEESSVEIDTTDESEASVKLQFRRFYDADAKGLKSGNTHLHLMKLTLAEAHRYLKLVPQADDLDLVFLSHLRRVPDEKDYISNLFVLNSFGGGDLKRLSQDGVLFANGEEHRHNFEAYGEGYGHVMFLDITKLIEPVSIGPGIMKSGNDGIPLQRGIRTAQTDGATVIWCHNDYGMEDVPNWMAKTLDAQNIFDGGEHGSYDRTFYRYLNLGLEVPFSTGTDWFVYDFSRVYVPMEGQISSRKWLAELAKGRSFITNGPFLEFNVDGRPIGDTIRLTSSRELTINAEALGRKDFAGLEIIHNGKVIHRTASAKRERHFHAKLVKQFNISEPGWLAARIPLSAGPNEFGKTLFAHTSPIYVELEDKRIFHSAIAREMILEIEANMKVIRKQGVFDDESQREAVLQVHRQGLEILKDKIRAAEPR